MSEPDDAPYRGYDVLAKWATPSFDEITRRVLARRLDDMPEPRFFSQAEIRLLEKIVARLAPRLPGLEPALVARWIDDRVQHNLGEGFRSENEPALQERWRSGLNALDGEAQLRFHAAFVDLDPYAQDHILEAIQQGTAVASDWRDIDPKSFFADTLLKTIAGLCYAHPIAWNDIGFGGPASPRGYVRLGFNARDPWEAKERR